LVSCGRPEARRRQQFLSLANLLLSTRIAWSPILAKKKAPAMERLTDEDHWDLKYDGNPSRQADPRQPDGRVSLVRRILGPKLWALSLPYHHYLYFEKILARYFPPEPGLKIMELGSAPGKLLVQLSRLYRYEPYGIDYSPEGVELNRQVFTRNGIDPDRVIQGDFLLEELRNRYREEYDIVWSHSLLEHFADPGDVVTKHLDYLKPDGLLVVYIPNLKGLNKLIFRFFDKSFADRHNLELMNRPAFLSCFSPEQLEILFCEYIGTFHLNMFDTAKDSKKRPILKAALQLQKFLNVGFRLLFRDRGWEHSWHSPGLLFVGRKK